MVAISFLKIGISNYLNSQDDFLWEEAEEREREETDSEEVDLDWDTDAKLTQEEWDYLFGSSGSESHFDGF